MSRFMFRFWLDDTKQDENELIGQVDELKQQRSFTKTIRDGIRLVTSLTHGSLDVLFELFPFVRAEFLEYVQEKISDNASAENDQLQQRIIELEAENAALKERNRVLEDEIEEDNDIIEAQDQELSILRKQKPSASDEFEHIIRKAIRDELSGSKMSIEATQSHESRPNSSAGLKSAPSATGAEILRIPDVPQFSAPTFDEDEIELEVKRDASAGDKAVQNFLKSAMGLQGMHHD